MDALTLILTILPSAIAVITEVGVLTIVKAVIGKCISKINDNSEMKELKDKMTIVIQENYSLRMQLNELLTKIDKVQR
jgi:nucleoside permease NupC